MPIVDMTNPEPPKEEAPAKGPYYDKYPYGLKITLNGQALEKLGLSSKDFNVKTTGNLNGTFKVVAVRDNQREKIGSTGLNDLGQEEGSQEVELQITGLSIDKMGSKPKGRFQQMMEDLGKGPGE